jgi:hypothetical protein
MSYHYITSPRRVPCMGMHVSVGCAIGAWTKEKRRSHTGLYAVVRRIASPRSVVVVLGAGERRSQWQGARHSNLLEIYRFFSQIRGTVHTRECALLFLGAGEQRSQRQGARHSNLLQVYRFFSQIRGTVHTRECALLLLAGTGGSGQGARHSNLLEIYRFFSQI